MIRYLLLVASGLLLAASCPAATPVVEPVPVTLKALGGDGDVPLFDDPLNPLPVEVGRVPPGTACTLLAREV